MSLSAVPAHVMFFIGALMITGAFVHDTTGTVQGIADSLLVQGDTEAQGLRTGLRFVNDPGSVRNDPVELYVLNTGSRILYPELVTLVANGDVVDRTVTELGVVDQEWRPGEVLRITWEESVPRGRQHFRVVVPPGVSDVFRPSMAGVNVPPVADFTYSTTTTPLAITVDASPTTDANGDTLAYDWTFGDGGTGTGITDSHGYATAGTYTVNLTVNDGQGGTGWLERQVVVYVDFVHTHEISHRLTGQHVRSTITVADHLDTVEAGVTVDAEICKSGGTCTTYSGTSKVDGTIEFTWSSIGAGTYTTCVTGLAKTDMWWDSAAGHATGGDGDCRTETV